MLGKMPLFALSSPPFDLASLSMTGWWQAGNYNSGTGTWNGTASAGGSGANQLFTNIASPTDGAALNGYNTVSFTRASSHSLAGSNLLTYFTVSAYAGWVLFKSTTQAANDTNPLLDDCLLTDTAGFFGLGARSTGPTMILQHDDGTQQQVTATFSNNAWQLVEFRKDVSTIEMRFNGSAWTTHAAGNLGGPDGSLLVGHNYNQTIFYDGLIADIGLLDSCPSYGTMDNIHSWLNKHYALNI